MNAPTRREKLRQQTFSEIKTLARAQLATDGPQGVSLRAIARDMEMAPAALYRYFPSLVDLNHALMADIFHEVADALVAATADIPPAETVHRIASVSRAFRGWARGHRNEFALVFGGGATAGPEATHANPEVRAGLQRFCVVFAEIFSAMWDAEPYPTPTELSDELHSQLANHPCGPSDTMTPAARYVFLDCWIWLYGFVAAEVFGQLAFIIEDNGDALFEQQMHDIALRLALKSRRDHTHHEAQP